MSAISKMKSSPCRPVGSMWSGSPERSRTAKRCSAGQRANSLRTASSSSVSTLIFLSIPPSNDTCWLSAGHAFLTQASVYFAAAVITVMLSPRLGLGSVAGYLLAGIAIGPWGFGLVDETATIHTFAELGVVFLLFVI